MPQKNVIHSLAPALPYEDVLADWMSRGMDKPGRTNAELAKTLKVGPSEVSKMKAGKRKILAAQLFPIAAYIDEQIPLPPESGAAALPALSIPILGEAGRAAWYEDDPVERSDFKLPFVPHDKYRELPHFATKVVGDDTNLLLPDGSYAVYVPYWQARKALSDKDFVLLKLINKDQALHKRLIRQVNIMPTHYELCAASADAKTNAAPIRLANDQTHVENSQETIEVIGLVVWQCGAIAV